MSNPYGPWATAIDAGRYPQLSAFWHERLTMLVPASRTSPVLSLRNLLGLVAAAVLVCALPTFHSAPAVAEQDKSPQDKSGNPRADARGTKSAAEADGEKQITNSIGMKLTLVPAGEFMMGSGESAEATAAFFNKLPSSRPTARIFCKQAIQGRASAAPRADHEAVLPGHLPCHAGPVPAVRRGHGLQDRRGEGRDAGGLGLEP